MMVEEESENLDFELETSEDDASLILDGEY
jgi:hypothetical protein